MSVPTEAQRLAERIRPAGRTVMYQRWAELLFLHWSWDPAAIQRTLPPGLTADTFGGRAWLGLVPFFMQRVRPRFCPAVPGWSDFLELNVRTYVHDAAGRPGVWFYSLDCNRWLAVKIARGWFHLRYEHAQMRARRLADGGVEYAAERRGDDHESRFHYRGEGEARPAAAGSLEFFLAERYRLYAHDPHREELWTGRVAHPPYAIMPVQVPSWDDRMLTLAGFDPEGRPPEHRCAARPVTVEIFPLVRV